MKTGKQLGNEPFSPIWCDDGKWKPALGLTKREYFAGLAMQAICLKYSNNEKMANEAVAISDALLEELSKE